MTKLPQTPAEVARQIDFFEWMKANTPTVYTAVVEVIEQRPERDL